MKNKILYLSATILFGCIVISITDCFYCFNQKKHLSDTSEILKNTKQNKFVKIKVDTTDIKFELNFHNNPFSFDSASNMAIAFNDTLIYNGKFSAVTQMTVPKKMLGRGIQPYLLIEKDGKTFDGWKKRANMFLLTCCPNQSCQ